jgi:OOP family OmpA-OmpF porin
VNAAADVARRNAAVIECRAIRHTTGTAAAEHGRSASGRCAFTQESSKMITRFNKLLNRSALFAALLVAGVGAARAEGLYFGGNLGSPDYKSSVNGIVGDGSGVGGKLYGGYKFTPNFALEGGAFDLGHIDDARGHVKLRGAYADAVGRYEFATKWTVLGSAGLAEGRFATSGGNDNSPALKLGAGVEYNLTRDVALRGEYEHFHFADAFDAKANVGEFSFGVNVGF